MTLSILDWVIIVVIGIAFLIIGISFKNKAEGSISDFFLGGRNLPWWIAGTSMVATTFATDTPLLVTELVATKGISGNWLWWNQLIGGVLTVFFFAQLWRRSGAITDIEITELRYGGKAASYLRSFKAIYLGLLMNSIIIAWVNAALITLIKVFFGIEGINAYLFLAGMMIFISIYSSLSGLLGIAITDFIQFFIAMGGCIVLAIFVVNSPEIGGISNLTTLLEDKEGVLDFLPRIGNTSSAGEQLTITFATFFSFVAVQWWASWYPGAEPGGGGYIAQRMMSTKNEKHAIGATLFFQLMHFCLRPWPWIIVAVCTLILYPELGIEAKKEGFVYAMRDYLPNGVKGLLIIAFLSAYMSTISTQLNLGASYLVNDFYIKRLHPTASSKQAVKAGRIGTFILMLFSLIVTSQIKTIESAFIILIECGAGLGLVLILRWYWYRINVWSEISSTIAPIPLYFIAHNFLELESPYSLFFIVGLNTVIWLIVTFVTKPEEKATLNNFYKKIKPEGVWKNVDKDHINQSSILQKLILVFITIISLYALLFFIGKLILTSFVISLPYLAVFMIGGGIVYLIIKKSSLYDN